MDFNLRVMHFSWISNFADKIFEETDVDGVKAGRFGSESYVTLTLLEIGHLPK